MQFTKVFLPFFYVITLLNTFCTICVGHYLPKPYESHSGEGPPESIEAANHRVSGTIHLNYVNGSTSSMSGLYTKYIVLHS